MTLSPEIVYFSFFLIFVLTVIYADLFIVGKGRHKVTLKESTIWTLIWVGCAILFYFFILFYGDKIHGINDISRLEHIKNKYGSLFGIDKNDFQQSIQNYRQNMSLEYITGYLIEYSLSVDNIFVILMILLAYSVSVKNYKRVLFFGILGAIILRFIFIFAGAALLQKFEWLLIVFGIFLLYTGIRMFIERNKEEKIETGNNKIIKFFSKHFSVFPRYLKDYFFIKRRGKIMITPLFMVLIIIEFTDLLFAVDSIPAIFSVTRDPFVVFFSNIFAILGLRSLFFLLINFMNKFHYLKAGLSVLLIFIGTKLVLSDYLKEVGFKTVYSLYIILTILLISVIASLLYPKNKQQTV
ncbi:MAG: TerC/Alx family metal homeostasis membrane protein [Bacteroidota bacterium]|nr:TerC/Alx family metal homeostasis membrane protein [Bacteroidota bacterium]